MDTLYDIVGQNGSQHTRKCLRPTEIKKSEKRVETVTKVLKEDLINPFSTDLASEKLYNLASGCPLPDVVSNLLLSVRERGRKQKEEFDVRTLREENFGGKKIWRIWRFLPKTAKLISRQI